MKSFFFFSFCRFGVGGVGWGGGGTAGLEINFFRQAPKSVNNTNQNLWSPIFLLRIRTKRAPLGPQRRFFAKK